MSAIDPSHTGHTDSDWEKVACVLDFLFDREPDLFFWQDFQRMQPLSRDEVEAGFQSWASCSVREFSNRIRPIQLNRALKPGTAEGEPWEVDIRRCSDRLDHPLLYYSVLNTRFGPALFSGTEEALFQLEFLPRVDRERPESFVTTEFPGTSVEHRELRHFKEAQAAVNGLAVPGLTSRPIPIALIGTEFQVAVWKLLLAIPPGALITYGDLAMEKGSKRKARAVGKAVGANRLGYVVPCHRVVGQDGVIGHFRWGSTRKKAMIGVEQAALSP